MANSGARHSAALLPGGLAARQPAVRDDARGTPVSVVYNTNTGRSSYNSLQVQVTARPMPGISTSATWVWAKSFNLPGSGYIDPENRNLNYGVQAINAHSLRTNGTVELPIGPNKLLFGNCSGLVARLIERWQTSFIFNASRGTRIHVQPRQSHYYAVSGYDVVSPNWAVPTSAWNDLARDYRHHLSGEPVPRRDRSVMLRSHDRDHGRQDGNRSGTHPRQRVLRPPADHARSSLWRSVIPTGRQAKSCCSIPLRAKREVWAEAISGTSDSGVST